VAIAMILKKITRLGFMAAYKGVVDRSGWMTRSKGKELQEVDLNILDPTKERIFHLMYRLPDDCSYHDLPFRVGGIEEAGGEDAPQWLVALNLALASSSAEDWRGYAIEAGRAGISEKSISKTLEHVNF